MCSDLSAPSDGSACDFPTTKTYSTRDSTSRFSKMPRISDYEETVSFRGFLLVRPRFPLIDLKHTDKDVMHSNARYTLQATHCKQQTPHCTLYTANCKLHTAHCTLHTAHYTLHATYCTMHTAHCTLHNVHCTRNTAYCTLHTAHCILYTAHCTLHIARAARYAGRAGPPLTPG